MVNQVNFTNQEHLILEAVNQDQSSLDLITQAALFGVAAVGFTYITSRAGSLQRLKDKIVLGINWAKEAAMKAISVRLCQSPFELSHAYEVLRLYGIYNAENRAAVSGHPDPRDLSFALIDLSLAGILTTENRAVISRHQEPRGIVSTLIDLQQAGILTEETRKAVAEHRSYYFLSLGLITLHQSGILTKENRYLIENHQNPVSIAVFLSFLDGSTEVMKVHLEGVGSNLEDCLDTHLRNLNGHDKLLSGFVRGLVTEKKPLKDILALNGMYFKFLKDTPYANDPNLAREAMRQNPAASKFIGHNLKTRLIFEAELKARGSRTEVSLKDKIQLDRLSKVLQSVRQSGF